MNPRAKRLPKIKGRTTMIEPAFVSQTAEPLTAEESRGWFKARSEEARAQGCRHARYSVDDVDKPTMWLFEGWRETAREVAQAGGDGEQRWAFQRLPPHV